MSTAPDLAHVDVRYVADLARIALTDTEAERYQDEIDRIVAYVRQLQELDVDDIEPTAHASPIVNVMRDDVPRLCLSRETVLANAPAVIRDDSFRVPAVIPGQEEGA